MSRRKTVEVLSLALALILAGLCFADGVVALNRDAILPQSGISVVESGGADYFCAQVDGRVVSGREDPANPNYFIPREREVARVKRALRSARGKRKGVLTTKLKQLRDAMREGEEACASLPRPTPTPDGGAYFDEAGNLTPRGKALLLVPIGLEANIYSGEGVFQARCTSCHGERGAGVTMPVLRTTLLTRAGVSLLDRELAHLVAYLNRGLP